jgi:hypothetical protein
MGSRYENLEAEYLKAQNNAFQVGMKLRGVRNRKLSNSSFNAPKKWISYLFSRKNTNNNREKRRANLLAKIEHNNNWTNKWSAYQQNEATFLKYKELYDPVKYNFDQHHDITKALTYPGGDELAALIKRYEDLGGIFVNAEIIEHYPEAPTIVPAYISIHGDKIYRGDWASSFDYYKIHTLKRAEGARHLLPLQRGGHRRTQKRKVSRTLYQ